MHGQGVFTYPDGRRHEGQYENDKKNGPGIMFMQDGRRFEGEWVNGRQHGDGQIVNTDGSIKRGKWHKGKPIQWYDEGAADNVNFRPSMRMSEVAGRDTTNDNSQQA